MCVCAGKYVGNRPIKLRKSTWKDRSIEIVRKKDKEKKRLGLRWSAVVFNFWTHFSVLVSSEMEGEFVEDCAVYKQRLGRLCLCYSANSHVTFFVKRGSSKDTEIFWIKFLLTDQPKSHQKVVLSWVVAQLVQCQTGTLLRPFWFLGPSRDFSPRINFQCTLLWCLYSADSLMVSVQCRLPYGVCTVQTLLQCLYSPRVQLHALTSVHALKIPDFGSRTFVWWHKNATRTVRNG